MPFKPFDHETTKAINKLKRLKPYLGNKSIKARIDFALTVFTFDLYEEIRRHDLFDNYGLSGRDLDTCFEMGDGDAVVHAVMKQALQNPSLKANISSTGKPVWDHWLKIYQNMEKQQPLF